MSSPRPKSPNPKKKSSIDAYIREGKLAVQKNDLKKAIACFNQVLKIDGKNIEAYLLRGAVLQRGGRLQDALQDINRAIELSPKPFARAYHQRSQLYQALGNEPRAMIDSLVAAREFGRQYLDAGDPEKAMQYLERALKMDNRQAELYNLRGMANFLLGDSQSALNDFDFAIGINPNNAESYVNRSAVQWHMGKEALAEMSVNKAIQIDEKHPDAYAHRASMAFEGKNYKRVIEDCTMAIKLDKENLEAYRLRAWSYFHLKDDERCLKNITMYEKLSNDKSEFKRTRQQIKIRKTQALDPKLQSQIEALIDEAETLNRSDKFRKAEKVLQKAVKLAPQYAFTYAILGDTYRLMEQWEQALNGYEQAVKFNPESFTALYGLGIYYIQKRKPDYDEALKYLNQAIDYHPRELPAYRMRAIAKMNKRTKEDLGEAIDDFNYYLRMGGGMKYKDEARILEMLTQAESDWRKMNDGNNWDD